MIKFTRESKHERVEVEIKRDTHDYLVISFKTTYKLPGSPVSVLHRAYNEFTPKEWEKLERLKPLPTLLKTLLRHANNEKCTRFIKTVIKMIAETN